MKLRTDPAPVYFASVFLLLAATALALSGCGKGKSLAGAKADPAASEIAAAAQIVSNRLAALAATGEPVTCEALNQWYPEPPMGKNAAVFYGLAFAALAPAEDNAEATRPATEAAEYKECRYPIDLTEGVNTSLPHLSKVKTSSHLLKSEAVSQAAGGHTDAAAQALLANLALARSLQNEPYFISSMVEWACLAITLQAMEQALSNRAFTEEQLLSLQDAWRQTQIVVSHRRALVGERATLISVYQMSPEALTNSFMGLLTNSFPDEGMSAEIAQLLAERTTVTFQQDFEFVLDLYSNALAIADMPFPQGLDPKAQQVFRSMVGTAQTKGYHLASLFFSTSTNFPARAGLAVATIRIAQAGLGLERYRLKHDNALPDSLAQLTPEFLDAVPDDPFDGQPLRYKNLPSKGYVIYSIGKDRKDDGGAAKSTDGKRQFDYPFTVQR